MSMKKKLLIAFGSVAAALVLVVTSVLGTVAYLTASAAVSNVFTVGNVQITMDETKVDRDGVPVENGGRVDTNTYHLVPAKQYTKDPQIQVNAGSENSYLFVLVRNDLEKIGPRTEEENGEAPDPYLTIAEQMAFFGWKVYTTAATGTVYVYVGTEAGNDSLLLPNGAAEVADFREELAQIDMSAWKPAALVQAGGKYNLFKYFYTNTTETNLSTYGAAKITLTAVAIQASGFGPEGSKEAVDKAWEAVKEAYPYIHTGSN